MSYSEQSTENERTQARIAKLEKAVEVMRNRLRIIAELCPVAIMSSSSEKFIFKEAANALTEVDKILGEE